MEWFRLYNEFATDAKLLSFTKAERYDVLCLLCLASGSQERGTLLLDDEDVSAYLSLDQDQFERFTARLMKKTILERTPEGWLRFTHWEERQPVSDSAAGRMRNYRAKQKTNAVQNSSEACSTPLRNGDVTVTDRSEQNRTEKNDDDACATVACLQHADDTWDADSREQAEECRVKYGGQYGLEAVNAAIQKAQKRVNDGYSVTSLTRYVETVLTNKANKPARASPTESPPPVRRDLSINDEQRAQMLRQYELSREAT